MFSFVQKLFKGYCYVSDDVALACIKVMKLICTHGFVKCDLTNYCFS